MGWQTFYRRRDALNNAVEQGELRTGDIFETEGDLLAALHHRWQQRLFARVELAMLDTDDQVDAVAEAWQHTTTDNADLRALLDRHASHPALRPLVESEQRRLAHAAGLTEPGDSDEEAASIGAAFIALQRTAPHRTHRNPVERLLRRLVPSA